MKMHLIKQVHSCFAHAASTDVWLARDIDMPYAPTVESKLKLSGYDKYDEPESIQEIYWDEDSQTLIAYVDEDLTLRDVEHLDQSSAEKAHGVTLNELVDQWVSRGWKKSN